MSRNTNIPVVNIILRRDEKVLFLKRKKTGWMDGSFGLPSGHVEARENFRQAACRELEEETGIKLKPSQLLHCLTFHQWDERGDIRVGIYFEAKDWSGEPQNTEPEKHSEITWLDPFDSANKIIPTTRYKLEQIEKGVNYLEVGWN